MALIIIDTIKVNISTFVYPVIASDNFSGIRLISFRNSEPQPKPKFYGQSLSYDSSIPATQAALNDSVPEVRREAAKEGDWLRGHGHPGEGYTLLFPAGMGNVD